MKIWLKVIEPHQGVSTGTPNVRDWDGVRFCKIQDWKFLEEYGDFSADPWPNLRNLDPIEISTFKPEFWLKPVEN